MINRRARGGLINEDETPLAYVISREGSCVGAIIFDNASVHSR